MQSLTSAGRSQVDEQKSRIERPESDKNKSGVSRATDEARAGDQRPLGARLGKGGVARNVIAGRRRGESSAVGRLGGSGRIESQAPGRQDSEESKGEAADGREGRGLAVERSREVTAKAKRFLGGGTRFELTIEGLRREEWMGWGWMGLLRRRLRWYEARRGSAYQESGTRNCKFDPGQEGRRRWAYEDVPWVLSR